LFRLAEENSGKAQSEACQRSHLLEISGQVSDGVLEITCEYSRNRHLAHTIEKFAESYVEVLREIIARCPSVKAITEIPPELHRATAGHSFSSRPGEPGGEEEEAAYSVSPMQAGILFDVLSRRDPGHYVQQSDFVIERLNKKCFLQAWYKLVEQYPVLRTSFGRGKMGVAAQKVWRKASLNAQLHDWRQLGPIEQQQQWRALLASDRMRGFDLAKPPLLRLTLAQIDAHGTYRVLWTFHHLLLDGWSAALLMKQLCEVYASLCKGIDRPLPPSRPYRDYIEWLRQQDTGSAKSFWLRVLEGFQSPGSLLGKSGGTRLSAQHEQKEAVLQLSSDFTGRVREFLRRSGLTLNTFMQGAWALLLSRYTGRDDVLFGAVVSGRTADLPGIESMIGLFINTIPVRVPIRDQPVISWLKELQAFNFELRQHDYISLVDIQGWSQVPRGQRLFDSLLVIENYPVQESVEWLTAIGVRDIHLHEKTNIPLTLLIEPGTQLSFQVNYDAGIFEGSTIRRLLCHLQELLEVVLAYPQCSLPKLPMLTKQEHGELLLT